VCLFCLAVGLCTIVISVPYLGNIVFKNWELVKITLPQFLLIVIIIQAAFPLSSTLIKFFDMINTADE